MAQAVECFLNAGASSHRCPPQRLVHCVLHAGGTQLSLRRCQGRFVDVDQMLRHDGSIYELLVIYTDEQDLKRRFRLSSAPLRSTRCHLARDRPGCTPRPAMAVFPIVGGPTTGSRNCSTYDERGSWPRVSITGSVHGTTPRVGGPSGVAPTSGGGVDTTPGRDGERGGWA